MAHPCVSDPPIVLMGNKDKDSEDTETEEMPQTMEDVDLEEGEIVDSCCEMYGESDKESKKLTGSIENTAIHTSEGGDELDLAGRKKKRKKKKKRKDDGLNEQGKPKRKKRYIDHDRVDDDETWFAINPMPYTKKNFNRIIEDGRSPSPGSYDNLFFNSEKKSSPSQDDDEHKPKEEKERKNKKAMRKNANKRQNSERGTKKKRKDGSGRSGSDSKKRSALNKKRKVAKAKSRPICKFFMEGRCSKGPDCPFSHSTLPSVKKEICKFYLNGYCAKGPKCLYMHGEFPCKFFHTGAKCYSEANCLFSHDPLTDEMKILLDKYLESSKAEENKKDGSGAEDAGSPPKQQKRPSLLGSPPRHVKEAAETWRWQQHVLQMQQKRYSGPCNASILSPPHSFSRPNFYMDTLPRSPNKIPSLLSLPPISMPLNLNAHIPSHLDTPNLYSSNPEGESSSQEEWENNKPNNKEMEILLLDKITQGKENSTTNSTVKNFETKNCKDSIKNINENSNEENSTKFGTTESNDFANSSQDNQLLIQQSANSPPAETNLPPPTVVIPTHLPRRQRELYLRIQQHQKEAASGDSGTDGGEASEDPEGKAEDEERKENWYSSDEDDTEDQPLTAVLKKLREMPPPNRSHQNLGQSFSSNSTIDITKMLSEIRQQASQNPEANGSNISNQQSDFWQNLLGTIPSENAPNCNKQGSRDPRIRSNPSKSQILNVADISNKSPPFRDPRLQNRDPRLASRDPRVASPGLNNNPVTPRNLPPEKTSQQIWDMRPVINKPNDASVENKSVVNHIQYKLRSITPSQPNYSSYVFQCQSDPKLLNDPRLKKYFKQMSGLLRQQQHMTDNISSSSTEQNKKNHSDSQIKPSIITNDNTGHTNNLENWELSKPRITDPRILKSNLPTKPRQTENVTVSQNMPSEPVWTSTPINNTSSTTTVTSHLPKSVSDPRLTRLLHPPVDQRWHRSTSDQNQSESSNNSITSQKKSNITPTLTTIASNSKSQESLSKDKDSSVSTLNNNTKEQSVSEDDVENKESAENKKKITTINRKSSMNYASPLNSYEDSSSSSTGYNSYNRRPQAPQNLPTTKAQSNIPQPVTSTSVANEHNSQESSGQSSLSFLASEPSNEPVVAPEHTPSLKEVFKTIDPTASPFC